MSSIFLSHSSLDTEHTERIHAWLRLHGHTDVFLDFDKDDGIPPGVRWKSTLFEALKRANSVLLLVSDRWLASRWCDAEYNTAALNGKHIIPIILPGSSADAVAFSAELTRRFGEVQFVDLRVDWDSGLDRLDVALGRGLLQPEAFPIVSGTPPYLGLHPYTAADAGLYYGREREIRELMELLRQRTLVERGHVVVLLGASGAGKSSLLQAGLWRRLAHDPEQWLPVDAFIPQESPFRGTTPVSALAQAFRLTLDRLDACGSRIQDLCERLTAADPSVLAELLTTLRAAAASPKATLILALDQGEELLRASPDERERFVAMLKALVDGTQALVVLAWRADALDALYAQRILEGVSHSTYVLGRLPVIRFPEVITGPAKRAGAIVEALLVERLAADAGTGDALPLLSFCLERLWRKTAGTKRVTLAAYEALSQHSGLNPMESSIAAVADEVLAESPGDATHLASAFIPLLVDINDDLQAVRRRAAWEAMPPSTQPLLKRLVDARLLTMDYVAGDTGATGATIEVSHEALLRRWPRLQDHIQASTRELLALREIERAASEWLVSRRRSLAAQGELRHRGLSLRRAWRLAARPGWRPRLQQKGALDYLTACSRAQARRLMSLIAAVAVVVAVVASAVMALNSDYLQAHRIPSGLSPSLVTAAEADEGYRVGLHLRTLAVAGFEDEAFRMARAMNLSDARALGLVYIAWGLADAGKKQAARDTAVEAVTLARLHPAAEEVTPDRFYSEFAYALGGVGCASCSERFIGSEVDQLLERVRGGGKLGATATDQLNTETLLMAATYVGRMKEALQMAHAGEANDTQRVFFSVIALAAARRGDVWNALAAFEAGEQVAPARMELDTRIQEARAILAVRLAAEGQTSRALEMAGKIENKRVSLASRMVIALALDLRGSGDARGVFHAVWSEVGGWPRDVGLTALAALVATRLEDARASELRTRVRGLAGGSSLSDVERSRALRELARAEATAGGIAGSLEIAAMCRPVDRLDAVSSMLMTHFGERVPSARGLRLEELQELMLP